MKILYFARIRQIVGRGSEEIELPPSVTTVGALLTFLYLHDSPRFVDKFATPEAGRDYLRHQGKLTWVPKQGKVSGVHCSNAPHQLGPDGGYAKIVRVELLHNLHDEIKYDGLEALTRGIARDCDEARAYFAAMHTETHRQTTRDRI